jgi:fructose/tagatose bisphosphate aldolase
MDIKELGKVVKAGGEGLEVADRNAVAAVMDQLVYEAVFADEERKKGLFLLIKEIAKACGAVPSSIQSLYEEMGREYPGFTVPAINIRGLTYDVAKAIFRRALKQDVGALIFEIARSEIGYTKQRPLEYAAVVLAAAVKEGFQGPVLIQEAIEAEFYNIDIDSSTLVDLEKPDTKEQQRPNFEKTAELADFIRKIQPSGIDVSIGGEIGEIGKANSTPAELKSYLNGFKETFKGGKGLSKLSVQSGTSHGGVVLPDGTLAKVKIDFETLRQLSDLARKDYGLAGAVQHGASTLPEDAFTMFPETTTAEVHLATGFQNIIYDSKFLPEGFRNEVYDYIKTEFAKERKEGQTEEQFIYSTRKKGFGTLKKKWWDLSPDIRGKIMKEIEQKFDLLFTTLKVIDTREIVEKTVKPTIVRKEIPASILKEL